MESLTLFYPHGTIADFTPLAGLPRLKHLHIAGDPAGTAADLKPIGWIASLETLWLDGAWVSDEAMAHLGKLSNLVHLGLGQPSLTDTGVEHIERLENLKTLRMDGSHVSTARIIELKQNRPRLEVSR